MRPIKVKINSPIENGKNLIILWLNLISFIFLFLCLLTLEDFIFIVTAGAWVSVVVSSYVADGCSGFFIQIYALNWR